MTAIIAFILIDTVIQLFVCKFSLWFLLSVIARLLFSCRAIGATFKVKTLAIVEIVAIACMWLWHIVFKGDGFPWLKFGLFILFNAISCFLMYVDEIFYVYVIEDVEDDD